MITTIVVRDVPLAQYASRHGTLLFLLRDTISFGNSLVFLVNERVPIPCTFFCFTIMNLLYPRFVTSTDLIEKRITIIIVGIKEFKRGCDPFAFSVSTFWDRFCTKLMVTSRFKILLESFLTSTS